MSSTASTPIWVLVIGPIAGALVGFASASLIDLWRNRRRVKVEQTGGLCFFAKPGTIDPGMHRARQFEHVSDPVPPKPVQVWVRCEPDDQGAVLFIFAEVTAANLSYLDDAMTDIYLVLGPREGVPPRGDPRIGQQRFRGVNLRAHSIVLLTLRFEFDKQSFEQFPNWRFERATKYTLVARTIRHQKVVMPIEPAASIMASNPGDIISRHLFESDQ
jgi:hypothetical protein